MPDETMVAWIDAAPKLERSGDGFRVSYRSGAVEFRYQMSRASFRLVHEHAKRLLAEAESEDTILHFPMVGVA